MSELTLLALQLGFLVLLWVFVFAVVYALRSDLFGKRVRKVNPDSSNPPPPTPPSGAPLGGAPAAQSNPVAPTAANQVPASAASNNPHVSGSSGPQRLVITSGTRAGNEFPLGVDEITIGRSSDSAIIIRDDYTSTHHARLMLWSGQWMIQDLDSTNGTFLNGQRVGAPIPVPLNTPVQVGQTTFELRR